MAIVRWIMLLFYASKTIPNYTFTLCEHIHKDAQKFQFCICIGTQVCLYGIMNKHREPIKHVQIVDYVCAIARPYCSRMLKHKRVNWPCHTKSFLLLLILLDIRIIYCLIYWFFSFFIYIFGFSQISCFYWLLFIQGEQSVAVGPPSRRTYSNHSNCQEHSRPMTAVLQRSPTALTL